MDKKLNCWEIRNCGRQPGGPKVKELGVCPAALDSSCNGINGGKNAGRCCWAVVGTLCEGVVQSDMARKMITCVVCDVFRRIREEEGEDKFVLMKQHCEGKK